MTSAADLSPGDQYRAADGVLHTVKDSWSGGIRCYIVHDDGTERILFPHTKVTLEA